MEIITLQAISISSLTAAFNKAFSDYEINLSFTEENFRKKIISENIIPEYSVGAFADGELIAFILHGYDDINGQKSIYNAGTGVLPKYRGLRIIEKLYNYILPVLKDKGFRHHYLEVLSGNEKAEKIYAKMGFTHFRRVVGYSGNVPEKDINNIEIRIQNFIDWNSAKSFCDTEPTWQNSFSAIQRTIDNHNIVTAYYNNEFAGFAIYDNTNGRIKQFGVKKEHRRKGIGTALFGYISKTVGQVAFTNYDSNDTSAAAFFNALTLKPSFELIEMKLFY